MGCAQETGVSCGGDDLRNVGFYDGRLAATDQIDFGGNWIDA
jgi:hypothetical protein